MKMRALRRRQLEASWACQNDWWQLCDTGRPAWRLARPYHMVRRQVTQMERRRTARDHFDNRM